MKIAFDVRVLKNKRKTGVEEYTKQLLKHLLKIDKKNQYVLFYTHSFSIQNKLEEFKQGNVEFRHIGFSNKTLSLIWKFWGLPPADWLIPGGVDLFFSPHINILPVANCRKIVVVHDLAFLKHPHFFTWWQQIWHKYMANSSIPQADIILTVSENTKNDIISYYRIPEQRIRVIYPGARNDLRPFSEKEKNDFRNKAALPEKFILYLGTLEPRKNIATSILAFSRLKLDSRFKELKFLIIGKKGWMFNNIFRCIRKNKLENEVIYIGYISEEEKNGYLACAECFIYPSYYEGFGFPPLEAFMVGIPVVTSNISSIPEITGGAALEVNPFDDVAISKGIAKILLNKDYASKLVQKGYDQVKKFSWAKTAEEILKTLEN